MSIRAQDILLLFEMYFDLLYHATTYNNAILILREDTMKTGSYGNISFTRNPNFWWSPSQNVVRFVVNGEMLSYNYSMTPLSYAGDVPDPRGSDRSHGWSLDELTIAKDIKNIKKYLKGIEVNTAVFFIRHTEADLKYLEELIQPFPMYLTDMHHVRRFPNRFKTSLTNYQWRKSL